MKGIFVILDGAGDLPIKQLDGKTPLEAAETPNLDFLAARGKLGVMNPVKPGFIPESDEAIVSFFRNELFYSTRGQLEACGVGLAPKRGDLVLRTNFATIDSLKPGKGNIIDRRAGRTLTTKEAEQLAKAINKQINLPVKFEFKPGIQHRGVLIFYGGFSDNISNTDISYYERGSLKTREKIRLSQPLDDDENSQYTANILNEFLEQAHKILENHPINEQRKKKGLMPANFLLTRGAGIEIPKLKQYKNWVSIAYMPLEIGFSKLSGMKVLSFRYPKMKKLDVYSVLHNGLKKACKYAVKYLKKSNKKFDYAYVHFKETDIPGHDNKPFEKKLMIELIDRKFFYFLRKFAPPNNIRVLVTADHSTPCHLKQHSADPVPVLLYDNSKPEKKRFTEKEAKRGEFGHILGKELLKKSGFLK